jgi:hypothetical protein
MVIQGEPILYTTPIDARLSRIPSGRGPATGKSRSIPDSRSALLIGYQTDMLHPFGFIEPCLPTISRTVSTGAAESICVLRLGISAL